jgi:hypothetical protein
LDSRVVPGRLRVTSIRASARAAKCSDIAVSHDHANAVAIQPDGKIVAAGFSVVFGPVGSFDFALVRYMRDPSFAFVRGPGRFR